MRNYNPGAVIENKIRYKVLKDFFRRSNKVDLLLDLGCGTRPYYDLYRNYASKSLGADLPDSPFPKENIDIYCDATEIPLENESVDTVLCTEVMHDIAEPRELLQEIKRVLKKDGTLILTTPFVVPTVDGKYDHFRFTEQGLKYLLNKEMFSVVEIIPVSDVIGAMLTLYVKPWLRFWNKLAKFLGMRFIYSRKNPLFYLTVTLPQSLYLWFGEIPFIRSFYRKFSYGPIGYISFAVKK